MKPTEIQEIVQGWIPGGAAFVPAGGAVVLIGLCRADRAEFAFMEAFAEDQHQVHTVAYDDAQYSTAADVPELQLFSRGVKVGLIAPIESDATGEVYPELREMAEAWVQEMADQPTRERYQQFFTINAR